MASAGKADGGTAGDVGVAGDEVVGDAEAAGGEDMLTDRMGAGVGKLKDGTVGGMKDRADG